MTGASHNGQGAEPTLDAGRRAALVERGLRLTYLTLGYNMLEAAVSLTVGVLANSVALVGFGVDSLIEVSASLAARWRLRADANEARRERSELTARRAIGWSFLALACYVTAESSVALLHRERPERTVVGMGLLAASVLVMPVLARAKRRVATELRSGALRADAKQTSLCAYLSLIALSGVALNALFGWWWADPVAALGMVPIIAWEGRSALRAR